MEENLTKHLFEAIAQTNADRSVSFNDTNDYLYEEEKSMLAAILDFLVEKGASISMLADCHNLISSDTLNEQIYFLKNKKYRYSTYDQVKSHVYNNMEYMKKYMYGLMLTGFTWKNHVQLNRWYVDIIPKEKKGQYLEIGPGHGYHMMTAMTKCAFEFYEGIDISPTSVMLTQEILSKFASAKKDSFKIYEADFLTHDFDKQYDVIVMGEVLEHVEDPGAFLGKIARIAKPDSFIYITTAINAPAVDHIYLFDSPQSVVAMVEESGMEVKNQLLVPYKGMSLEKSIRLQLPISVGLVIQ